MAPQNPGATRRRSTTGIRRPKVAGTAPDTRGPQASPAEPPAPAPAPHPDARVAQASLSDARATQASPADVEEPRAGWAEGLRRRLPAPPRTRRGTLLLAGATVVLLALAVLAGVSWWTLRSSPAAQNTALVDVAATSQVSRQLGDAVKTVYSYDFARLDENEAAAREVITPAFAQQFDQLFGEVRSLAPQQQAVVTATISQSAVESITGDRAVLVVFLDQQATRAAGDQQQVAAAGRLTVTGELVDGTWKIAAVTVA